jgi:hypothetical protein
MSSPKKPAAKQPTKPADKKVVAKPIPVNKSATTKTSPPEELVFAREYWTGDSRDGALVNGDGYHYYRMTKSGKILEAYECYELEDGRECANPLPEMLNVHWIEDLGFEDFEALDMIKEIEFSRIKEIASGAEAP